MAKSETLPIRYTRGNYKYQLVERAWYKTNVTGYDVGNAYVHLYSDGWMSASVGYAWDGPSGPTIDTPDFMRGSLFHDGFYQLMRLGLLPESCRKPADKILVEICKKDGMPFFRRAYVYVAVRRAGSIHNAAAVTNEKIISAP